MIRHQHIRVDLTTRALESRLDAAPEYEKVVGAGEELRPVVAALDDVLRLTRGFSLTPDSRVIFKQGGAIEPARYLRVVPQWVDRMKRAVDEANR